MIFYLGTDMPGWLWRVRDVPLFVSHRRLAPYRNLRPAVTDWALDSGGFTEISTYGEWRTTPRDYVKAARRYVSEVGRLRWASPQDWMCEPWIISKTGLSIEEHQRRTVDNYLLLRDLAPDLPFVPVLQGWALDDYRRHVDAYATAGVDLFAEATVGIGSVCRRQHTGQIERVLSALAGDGINLHGFGLKIDGLRAGSHHLRSADSMAWSFSGRRTPRLIGHTHKGASEAHCLDFALAWRARVADVVAAPKQLALEGLA